ncbi:hypothetical protein C9374_008266 [Naegleria lovaniensis]|uniref:Uncharacterized protein n=1 Tax=Naegleria lovaniensis TaxID=51637 RepID=A0AA88KFT9_NAELO|nr:uncharacterized protein C9374_008266 [Naegleria lovaniensis]KAG2378627.1 hypothetical protein C9374_008266 [Naegleria lovaniensis]
MKRNVFKPFLSSALTAVSARNCESIMVVRFKFMKASLTRGGGGGLKNLLSNHHHGPIRAFHSSPFILKQEIDINHDKLDEQAQTSSSDQIQTALQAGNLLEEQFQQMINLIETSKLSKNHTKMEISNELVQFVRSVNSSAHTIHAALGQDPKLFFGSSVGMRAHLLHRELHLIFLKALFQEWFDLQALKSFFVGLEPSTGLLYKYPKSTPQKQQHSYETSESTTIPFKDDTHFLCTVWDAQLTLAAAPSEFGNKRVFTREVLIANFYWLFTRLKDIPLDKQNLFDYAKLVMDGYKATKEFYVKGVNKDVDYSKTITHDAEENAFSFTRRTFSEDEFDWFEDLETNLPLHLGACFKTIEIIARIKKYGDHTQMLADLDECLKINPNNPYILYLKGSLCRHLLKTPTTHLTVNYYYQVGIESCNAALNILKNQVNIHFTSASPHLDRLSKTRFDTEDDSLDSNDDEEYNEAPIPDLKFTPILFLRSTIHNEVASDPKLIPALKLQYATHALNDLKQTERFSRMPNEYSFLINKGQTYYFLRQFDKALMAFAAIEKFETILTPSSMIHAICSSVNCMIELGHAQLCLEKLEEYIVKYNHHPALVAHKLDCYRVSCRSKDDLKKILPMFQEFADSLKNISQKDPHSFIKYYPETLRFIETLQKAIDDPLTPERW